jgi:predicted HicB family RNase H-like nuclease
VERADEIEREFRTSVDEYLAFCAERGMDPDPPFSGKLLLRVDAYLHRSIAAQAATRGVSINKWIEAALTSQCQVYRSSSSGLAASAGRRVWAVG